MEQKEKKQKKEATKKRLYGNGGEKGVQTYINRYIAKDDSLIDYTLYLLNGKQCR